MDQTDVSKEIKLITIILIILSVTLLVACVFQAIVIRGFLRTERSNGSHRHLSGREVEELRRKLVLVGIQAITIDDVYNLIMTIRHTHMGLYVDDDPYMPADPYGDIDEKPTN